MQSGILPEEHGDDAGCHQLAIIPAVCCSSEISSSIRAGEVRRSAWNVQTDSQLSSHTDRRHNHPQLLGVTPLHTDELTNIAGSYRVPENHRTGPVTTSTDTASGLSTISLTMLVTASTIACIDSIG